MDNYRQGIYALFKLLTKALSVRSESKDMLFTLAKKVYHPATAQNALQLEAPLQR
jgi:hypothetical protein